MKKNGNWLISILLSTLLVAGLVACGGGGDGDSSGDDPPAQGPTNTIDATKVDEILDDISGLGIGCSNTGGALTKSMIVGTLKSIGAQTSEKVKGAFEAQRMQSALGVAEPQDPLVIPGTCDVNPGEIRIELTLDDETGEFSGTVTITNFCVDINETEQATAAGSAQFSGEVVQDTEGMPTSITFNASTTSPVSITSSDFSATIILTGFTFSLSQAADGSGSISVGWTVLDVNIQEDGESEFVTADNVAITITVAADGAVTITLQGEITTSDGSLVISTPTPISVNADGNITGGVLQIDGAEDTGVQITYTGTGYVFTVTADTDGDGNFDDYNETMDCTELGGDLEDF